MAGECKEKGIRDLRIQGGYFRKRSPLYVEVAGGLGNQLFQFATAFALAAHSKRSIRIIDQWYRGAQRGPLLDQYRREFCLHKFPLVREVAPRPSGFSQFIVRVMARVFSRLHVSGMGVSLLGDGLGEKDAWDKLRFIRGNLHDPQSFLHLKTDLGKLFVLESAEESELDCLLANYRSSGKRLVAMHVRRGDTTVTENQCPVPKVSYFRSALSELNIEGQRVLVFSDSPEWCQDHEFFGQFEVIDEPDSVRAFRLMCKCDDFVLSPSTMSWWASLLGDSPGKRIFAPSPYFWGSEENMVNLVRPEWINLKAQYEYDLD